ncbi:MAG: ABC transporter substrate-binding protein [Acidimicrobiia bacterium]|nr:MAG: ABC transporter substrate-binding protein [Acidimicrobiia bacterium]
MKRLRNVVLLLLAFALLAAACSSADDGDDSTETTTTSADSGTTNEYTDVDVSGTEVSVFAAPTGDEGASIQATFDVYNEATSGTVTYEGSDDFEAQLRIRVDGGNPPDIAITPQPGSICVFADAGEIVALEDMGMDIGALEAAHGTYFMNLGKCADGKHYSIPTNANYKSIVWYNKPAFETAGYAIPTTWDEMVALSTQIVADGSTPWCIGLGSDAATGWPGTDWIEDIMVRTAGADVYNQWTSNELPFTDPAVQLAFDTFGEIMFGEGFVLGGADGVAAIDFRDAPDPMFNTPPACLMHRQASFISNFFPEGVELGTDAAFFNFPAIDTSLPAAAMGGGELAMVFNNRPEVAAALLAYSQPALQCIQASGAGVPGIERISANAGTDVSCYTTDTVKLQASAVAAALAGDGFVFDGSDLMPPAVGQGSFWTGMVDWTRGTPTAEILTTIQDSWPSS